MCRPDRPTADRTLVASCLRCHDIASVMSGVGGVGGGGLSPVATADTVTQQPGLLKLSRAEMRWAELSDLDQGLFCVKGRSLRRTETQTVADSGRAGRE